MSIESKRRSSNVSLYSSGRLGARNPKLEFESIDLLCTVFLGDLGDLGGLEWTDEVFQCLVAIWKFIGLEDSGRSIGMNSLSMKGYLSKRSFFCNGALQCRLSSRCFTPSLSLFLPEPAVFLVARRSPAFSGKVILLEIFTSLSTSIAIRKAWVNNYIVAAVGHTLFACNSCCKSSRMVLALAIITAT